MDLLSSNQKVEIQELYNWRRWEEGAGEGWWNNRNVFLRILDAVPLSSSTIWVGNMCYTFVPFICSDDCIHPDTTAISWVDDNISSRSLQHHSLPSLTLLASEVWILVHATFTLLMFTFIETGPWCVLVKMSQKLW